MSSQPNDNRVMSIGNTIARLPTSNADANFPEIGDVENLTVAEIMAEDADWVEDFGIEDDDGKAHFSEKMTSCEASDDDELDGKDGYVELPRSSLNGGGSENTRARQGVVEIGFRRPEITCRAHREQLEERYQQYEREYSSEEDVQDEKALKTSWLVSSQGDLGDSWHVPLPLSNDKEVRVTKPIGADLEAELALALEEDALNDPVELDATTLELIAYTESFRNPEARKRALKTVQGDPYPSLTKPRLYNPKPRTPNPFHHPLYLANGESSRTFPQDYQDWYEIAGSKGCLNDMADAAETLKIQSSDLASRSARSRKPDTLEDEILNRWLDQSIATTNELLRAGKTALASKASEMVGRVLANEKGVASSAHARSTTWAIKEESRDITSGRKLSTLDNSSRGIRSSERDSFAL